MLRYRAKHCFTHSCKVMGEVRGLHPLRYTCSGPVLICSSFSTWGRKGQLSHGAAQVLREEKHVVCEGFSWTAARAGTGEEWLRHAEAVGKMGEHKGKRLCPGSAALALSGLRKAQPELQTDLLRLGLLFFPVGHDRISAVPHFGRHLGAGPIAELLGGRSAKRQVGFCGVTDLRSPPTPSRRARSYPEEQVAWQRSPPASVPGTAEQVFTGQGNPLRGVREMWS